MEAASGKTILIVEDERDVVDLLKLNLRKAGFTVSTATGWRCEFRESAERETSFDYTRSHAAENAWARGLQNFEK